MTDVTAKGKRPFIDFVGKRKLFLCISGGIFVIIFLMNIIFGLEVAIEFKGGTLITYTYTDTLDINAFQSTVETNLAAKTKVTVGEDISTGSTTVQISLVSNEGLTAEGQSMLTNALQETYAENHLELLSSSDVNPSTGREFFFKCLVAVGFAFIVLIIYIALRFRKIGGLSAGVFAVVALLHDVIMVYGVFVICRLPIDANFMAVVLTILGYSINDTIVIYDRVRENQGVYRGQQALPRAQLVNLSINQSLTRSLITTLTTLMAMVVVCVICVIFQINSLLSFVLPIIIGMISGTYSTLCIAGPLWVWWEDRNDGKNNRHKNIQRAKTAEM